MTTKKSDKSCPCWELGPEGEAHDCGAQDPTSGRRCTMAAGHPKGQHRLCGQDGHHDVYTWEDLENDNA